MLKIKLSPVGRKGLKHYRISVMEAKSKITGRNLENLGTFDSHTKQLNVNMDKLKEWIKKGAQPTDRIKKICKIS